MVNRGAHPTRREVLKRSAGAAAFATLAPLAQSQSAQAQVGTGAAVHRVKLGAAELIIVSDGYMAVPAAMLAANVPDAELRSFLAARNVPAEQVRFHLNVALIKIGSELVLIDAGAGLNWEPTAGKIADSLEQAGIALDAISTVILTHAHPDHLWGVVDDLDDSLRFPKANYLMSDREFTFWMSPEAAKLQGPIEGIAAGAKRVLKAIEPRLTRIRTGCGVARGIVALDTPGHTPGHISLLVGFGGDQTLITADAIQNAHVAFAHPDWHPRADMDGDRAAKSRRQLLDMAANEKLSVLCYHVPFPGLGRIERSGSAYTWLPAQA